MIFFMVVSLVNMFIDVVEAVFVFANINVSNAVIVPI